MSNRTAQVELAVERLLQSDEGQLYEQIGIRSKAIQRDPSISGSFEPLVTYDQAKMGLKEDVLELGKRVFGIWNAQAYQVFCGSGFEDAKDREALKASLGMGDVAAAASLASLLVALGISPAIAPVVAALVIKRFFRPAYQEFCAMWGKHVSQTG